jgi:hypothetical protein
MGGGLHHPKGTGGMGRQSSLYPDAPGMSERYRMGALLMSYVNKLFKRDMSDCYVFYGQPYYTAIPHKRLNIYPRSPHTCFNHGGQRYHCVNMSLNRAQWFNMYQRIPCTERICFECHELSRDVKRAMGSPYFTELK